MEAEFFKDKKKIYKHIIDDVDEYIDAIKEYEEFKKKAIDFIMEEHKRGNDDMEIMQTGQRKIEQCRDDVFKVWHMMSMRWGRLFIFVNQDTRRKYKKRIDLYYKTNMILNNINHVIFETPATII